MANEIKMYLGTITEQEALMNLIDSPEWISDEMAEDNKASFWAKAYEC